MYRVHETIIYHLSTKLTHYALGSIYYERFEGCAEHTESPGILTEILPVRPSWHPGTGVTQHTDQGSVPGFRTQDTTSLFGAVLLRGALKLHQ